MKRQFLTASLIALALSITVSNVARAHEDGAEGHRHGHGNSAAAKLCKGQANPADKKACFKQLWQQRKAAMETFDKGFTYTPAAGPSASQ